jgi:hypothetical protein
MNVNENYSETLLRTHQKLKRLKIPGVGKDVKPSCTAMGAQTITSMFGKHLAELIKLQTTHVLNAQEILLLDI